MADDRSRFRHYSDLAIDAARGGLARLREVRPSSSWLEPIRRLERGRKGYCDLGIGPIALGLAFVLTIGFYVLVNSWLASRIDQTYRRYRPQILVGTTSVAESAERLIRAKIAPAELRPWLETYIDADQVASDQIEQLFRIVSTSEENTLPEGDLVQQRRDLLNRLATGSRSIALPFGFGRAQLTSGDDVFNRLSEVDPLWLRGLESTRRTDAKEADAIEATLRWLVSDLLQATEGPVRNYLRINGWIQWITVYLGFLIGILAVRRAYMLRRIRAAWSSGIPDAARAAWRGDTELIALSALLLTNQANQASKAELTMILQEEFGRLADAVEDRVYASLGFLLGCLPSIGFIGTILGMGEALLRANGLLNARNREQTISEMTQQLGFAFDTTLVALFAGLIFGFCVAWVRHIERRWLQDLESALVARVLPPDLNDDSSQQSTFAEASTSQNFVPPDASVVSRGVDGDGRQIG